ncbi:MAG: type II toxin-antitoxin system prevent-host-death family antitoxin, partial [Acidobacteria bacterium]
MKILNVHEAKTRLSSVLAEIAEKGEKFLICRNGKPV